MSKKTKELIPEKRILRIIMVIRGEKVILDSDLAELYGVETRRLNEQVRRNLDKFPKDFMFRVGWSAETSSGFYRTRRLAGCKCA